jgi:restriction endonuclease S subunit
LFAKTGTVGLTLVFPEDFGLASLADNIFKVKYKKDINVYYIDIFFKSDIGKLWVRRLSQGGVQPTITKNSFKKIPIPIASKELQEHIGETSKESILLFKKTKELIEEAKQDVEDLIEGKFDVGKIGNNSD